MNETQVLLDTVAGIADLPRSALATIVKVTGSAYRGPGARLLILPDGKTMGAVSAGCLERDLVERAQRAIAARTPALATYDTSDLGDNVWGLGIGCGGRIDVLIEPLLPDSSAVRSLSFLRERLDRKDTGVVGLVFRTSGVSAPVGARLLVADGTSKEADIADRAFAAWLQGEAQGAEAAGQSVVQKYEAADGCAEALLEVIAPPLPLIIFGAGDDAIPLARVADLLGWDVTVVDSRPALAESGRFPGVRLVVGQPDQVWSRLSLTERTAAVVMTHNYPHDLAIIRALIAAPIRYRGVLGTRKRTTSILRELNADPARIHAPVGLDIGGETPAEIALAIAAEIQAVCAGRPAGFLKDRPGSIHDRQA